MTQLKDIPNDEVIQIVRDHWKERDRLHDVEEYPPSCCDVLMERYNIPYKLARKKLEKMIHQGVLQPLSTPCVPARPE